MSARALIRLHDVYGRRIDRLEIEALHALESGNLVIYVALTAMAEEMEIAKRKAIRVTS